MLSTYVSQSCQSSWVRSSAMRISQFRIIAPRIVPSRHSVKTAPHWLLIPEPCRLRRVELGGELGQLRSIANDVGAGGGAVAFEDRHCLVALVAEARVQFGRHDRIAAANRRRGRLGAERAGGGKGEQQHFRSFSWGG